MRLFVVVVVCLTLRWRELLRTAPAREVHTSSSPLDQTGSSDVKETSFSKRWTPSNK